MELLNVILPVCAGLNKNLATWWQGRKHQKYPVHLNHPVWVHCASLGEFEQGRPVLEAIKRNWPQQPIVLTFFSPSGFEVRKNYPGVDWVGYLPLDTKSHAMVFIETIKPKFALFIKYEYWYHHLLVLQQNRIPYFFVAAAWRPDNFLLKWWTHWLLNEVRKAKAFFVQDQQTRDIMLHQGFEHILVVGDTRIDRVLKIVAEVQPLPYLSDLAFQCPVLVAGSTWPPDEDILLEFMKQKDPPDLIIAPHDPNPQHINDLLKRFEIFKPKLYSSWAGEPFKILIIDSIGLLNRLYAVAQAAYIGGGFGKGIHNTLEPAAYGIPVFFGPRIERFREAKDMAGLQTAFIINSSEDFIRKWHVVIPEMRNATKDKLAKYFADQKGATDKIIDYLSPFI